MSGHVSFSRAITSHFDGPREQDVKRVNGRRRWEYAANRTVRLATSPENGSVGFIRIFDEKFYEFIRRGRKKEIARQT